ncbi:DEAD/DEAH box helicase [Hydrogenophaga sp. BPS33]|uniref:DEAD/DEAH box helicase n=1 Tax=Hydrogenophaga sp. BPS33 TaxID=2651974 RepID=UPI00131FF784|nr:DEAD/DEAH box helicase [Hydrogenophaga sp. BPS33]QHE85300.1 DEAD/DEAH box helicase [Hydrogenophaga sp. BPS33]
MTFDDLNLAPAIVQAVREHGYETPTPIQTEAIPAILAGRDLLGGAQTGTGKTAAFTLPMLHRLAAGERPKSRFGGVGIRALVLTPTRELAAQVEESVRVYGKHLSLSSTVVFGGVGMNPQINAMKRGVDILVATPGRLLDLQQQGFLDLSAVQILVLDEADRMLDMGFIHDVKKVLALVPANKQSLLFSATFSDEIRDLASALLKDPQHIQVTPRNTTVQRITQVIHPVGRGKKKALLVHIINQHNWSQVLVFTRTKFGANNVAEYLTKNGIEAMALHGNKSQGARTQALAGFKSGEIRALVATDIAARGIDIDELPHVVNYEIPNVCEDYVHRIGRTGRAGNSGEAINLVSLDEEGFMMEIERFTKQQIPVQIFQEFMPEPGERAEPIAMGRQTIWGGAGKPPSREVMAAAAKAARTEMLQRVREKKASEGGGGRGGNGGGGQRQRPAGDGDGAPADGPRGDGGRRRGNGGGQRANGNGHGGGGGGNGQPRQGQQRHGGQQGQRPPREDRGPRMDRGPRDDNDGGNERQPGPNAHLGSLRIREPRPRPANAGGQPDPLRTSIDAMRTGNRGGKGGGRGGNGGGGGGQRGGGADPLRTSYGRIR